MGDMNVSEIVERLWLISDAIQQGRTRDALDRIGRLIDDLTEKGTRTS